MKREFLDQVQSAGWHISGAEENTVIGSCRAHGCTMRARLREGASIPQVCSPFSNPSDIPVRSFDDIRTVLRQRREDLALSIPEVEHASGMAYDHLAKCERPNPTRIPNIQIVAEWAASLGFELVLRPSSLPPISLRIICDSRTSTKTRRSIQGRGETSRKRA